MRERELFLAALDIEDPEARQSHLQAACAGDAELLGRVASLLASHESPSAFLAIPVGEQLGTDPTLYVGTGSTHDDGPALDRAVQGVNPMKHVTNEGEDDVPLGFLQPSTRPDSLGRLDHYEVLQVIGHGAFGIVLRAFDDRLQRVVAIKVMAPALASTSPPRKRFLREAQASAAIRHENVVSVYAVEELPLPFLVMEYIPGVTLQQRLDERGPLDLMSVLRLGRQVAEGLAAAHAINLIHRDIKPGNILLETGVHERVKITDFGLARAADDASLTQSGTIAGTPMFMAPEQALGEKLDQRADLFSFGSVLYQMVSGRPPFRAPNALAVLKRVAEEPPRPIQEIIPETPGWLCDIIAKLHAKNPADRFQSAQEVADLLADCEAKLKTKLDVTCVIPPHAVATTPPVTGGWKWLAAAVLLLPFLALVVTEFAGVTQLFRKGAARSPDGWVQLFNGTDLGGWKTHPEQSANWHVKNGVLACRGPLSHLFTERGDYRDFQLRFEWRAGHQEADSGVYFRCDYSINRGFPPGYELNLGRGDDGCLMQTPPTQIGGNRLATSKAIQPVANQWRTGEITVVGNRLTARIDGSEVAVYDQLSPSRPFGHIALEHLPKGNPACLVEFRKIEIKELPASASPAEKTKSPLLAIAPFTSKQAKQHQEAWAKHLGVPVEYTNSLFMKFRLIPPGEFLMGSTPEEIEAALLEAAEINNAWKGHIRGEAPRHRVVLTQPFYLGTHEVTQAEYQQMMSANPSYFGPQGTGKDLVAGVNTARFPVEMVSWQVAANFCVRLSEHEALPPCYSLDGEAIKLREGIGYRLPSEAEWEFACRAGTSTKFWNGSDAENLMQIGWFGGNSKGLPHAVGELPANPFGLHDMHGNIWEWVQDGWNPSFYASLGAQKSSNPLSPIDVSPARGARGGNFYVPAMHCRAADRGAFDARSVHGTVGFRAVLSVAAVKHKPKTAPEAKTPPTAVAPFTDDDVKRITALSAAEQVEEVRKELLKRNPEYTGEIKLVVTNDVVNELTMQMPGIRDLSPVRALSQLRYLEYSGGPSLEDISPLRGMSLSVLSIRSSAVSDLTPLKGMQLSGLELSGCQKLTDLSPLKDMPLTGLSIAFIPVKDLSPLKGMKLESFNCESSQVSDLAPLAGMPITDLNIRGTRVTDTALLKEMPLTTVVLDFRPERDAANLRSIKTLDTINGSSASEFWKSLDKPSSFLPFTDAEVKRIAALSAAEQIEEVRKELQRRNPEFDGTLIPTIEFDIVTGLEFFSNQVRDLSPVRALPRLKRLNCRGESLVAGRLADLSPLKGMQLNVLTCSVSAITDLSPLQGMPLTELHIDNSPVADLSPLAGLRLHVLNCSYTNVHNLRPLEGMPLLVLWCNNTGISDLAPLKDMKLQWITIQATKVTDRSPLQGMPLSQIYLDYDAKRDRELLRALITLQKINDKPTEEFWKDVDPK